MLDRRRCAVALEPSSLIRDPRGRTIDAFVRTVAREGYDRTTIEEVLVLAKVPEPVFYEHFEDRQDCLLAALEELIARIEGAVSEQVAASAPWSERVRIGLRTVLAVLAGHPDGARVAFVECLSAGEPAIACLRSAMARFVPALEEGRRCGDGPDADDVASASDTDHLPPQTSEAVVGGIASIVHRRVLESHTAELPTLLPDLLYFALMPYLGHERALTEAGFTSA